MGPTAPLRGGAPARVQRFAGPRGSTLHIAFAVGNPEQPLPANGGLRVVTDRLRHFESQRLSSRLATEMLLKHRLHRTGFWGAEMVVTGADVVDEALLAKIADVLAIHGGTLYTGADMGVSAADMELLATMSPYVLNGVGSAVEPNAATAYGVLGAIEAWARGPVAGLRVLVHGTGKVGGVLARKLAPAGATVLTCDIDPVAAAVPGCRPVHDWTAEDVDLLVPCSVSELIDPRLAQRLRCGAVIGSANALLAQEVVTTDILHRRGIISLPTSLVGAGAVIVDSIEHYAPSAFRGAVPDHVYAFAKETVRSATLELLESADGLSPAEALHRMPLSHQDRVCGLRFSPTSPDGGGQQTPQPSELAPQSGSGSGSAVGSVVRSMADY